MVRQVVGAVATLILLAVALQACESEAPSAADPDPEGFDRATLLASLGSCQARRTAEHEAAVRSLRDHLRAATAGSSDGGSALVDDELAEARDLWRAAMLAWQRMEPLQFGPAGLMAYVAAGADLREAIYSYPLVSACRVDQTLVEGAYRDGALATAAQNRRGLDALEALLFAEGPTSACPDSNVIVSSGQWAALEAELPALRGEYAAAAAEDLLAQASALADAWEDGSAVRVDFESPGPSNMHYTSRAEALGNVAWAMLYIDSTVRDQKVGLPAGLSIDCAADTCPELVEHGPSDLATTALRQNLLGLGDALLGCGALDGETPEPVGFDDYLVGVGSGDLAADLRAALVASLEAIEPLEPSLRSSIEADAADARALHAALSEFIASYKSQFLTVLDLPLPDAAPADND